MTGLGGIVAALATTLLAAVPFATAPGNAPAGWRWVHDNPPFVSALVVSMPAPPPAVQSGYFDDFGASALALWKDGAASVPGWGGRPFVAWLDPDGTSVRWDPAEGRFVSTGEVLGGLPAGSPGRIGFQIGDEPSTVAALDAVLAGMATVAAADPGALLITNLSYYASQREAVIDRWVRAPIGDVQLSSDYFLGTAHYTALERFRRSAQAKGIPYWQYLNAYIGSESDFARIHTVSDLRWQAMAGLTYGYTGHVWFFYQAVTEGHPTATTWGGSVLFDGLDDWAAARTPLWETVAAIDRELANLGRTVGAISSTAVRLDLAAGTSRPSGTSAWTAGTGGVPYLTGIARDQSGPPMDVLTGTFVAPDGKAYVAVQNARHTHMRGSAAAVAGGDEPGTVTLSFDFTGAPPNVDRTVVLAMDPATGTVRPLPLTPVAPAPPPAGTGVTPASPQTRATLQATLPAGGVLLFTYADTVPFRLGRDQAVVGVVDTAAGRWHLRDPVAARTFYYGNPGDVPFMGDWDCDGIDTPGLYRQSDGLVYLRNSNTQGVADVSFFFGDPGDVPLPGDFDGDGCDSVSLYRPSEGRFYVIDRLGTGGGLGTADFSLVFGDRGDRPLVGDFDGDGVDSFGVYRPTTGRILLRNSLTSGVADLGLTFGDPGDRIVTGDWEGDGIDTPAVFRPAEARFYLRFTTSSGPADLSYLFGESTFVPVAGVIH